MNVPTSTITNKKKRGFFDVFPTPRFLEMPAPGLALEDRSLRLVEFSRTKEGLKLKRFAHANVATGIIENGEIMDAAGLTAILTAFRKKYDLFHTRCIIPEEKGYLFQAQIPKVSSPVEIATAVEFIIEENVPLSVSESVFDFALIESPKEENFLEVAVSVVAAEAVRSYLSAFREAGLSPIHFEVESQAVAKAVVPRDDTHLRLLIHIFRNKIGLYLVHKSVVSFSSTIALSPDAFTEEAADEEHSHDKNRNHHGKEKKRNAIKKVSVRLPIEEIRTGTEKILSFWNSQADKQGKEHQAIEFVTVSGHGAHDGSIPQQLEFLNAGVSVANVWINAFSFDRRIPEIPREESLEYATAIGAALPHILGS